MVAEMKDRVLEHINSLSEEQCKRLVMETINNEDNQSLTLTNAEFKARILSDLYPEDLSRINWQYGINVKEVYELLGLEYSGVNHAVETIFDFKDDNILMNVSVNGNMQFSNVYTYHKSDTNRIRKMSLCSYRKIPITYKKFLLMLCTLENVHGRQTSGNNSRGNSRAESLRNDEVISNMINKKHILKHIPYAKNINDTSNFELNYLPHTYELDSSSVDSATMILKFGKRNEPTFSFKYFNDDLDMNIDSFRVKGIYFVYIDFHLGNIIDIKVYNYSGEINLFNTNIDKIKLHEISLFSKYLLDKYKNKSYNYLVDKDIDLVSDLRENVLNTLSDNDNIFEHFKSNINLP